MFQDRKDAGEKLAVALEGYKGKNVKILAIPRGGVEVGYHVARYLEADFSILVSRKLPLPDNPEAGFGAIAEDGSTYIAGDAGYWLPEQTIGRIIKEQKTEIKRRIAVLRDGKPLPEIADKIVILVDDGIAVGSTMRAAIKMVKNKGAKKIVVASPVSGCETADEIGALVDEIVVLEKPDYFRAVAEVYYNWYDVSDSEVIEIMDRWDKEGITWKTTRI